MESISNKANKPRPAGITLIETVLSLAILGGAFVAALNTIASARGAQATVTQRQLGLMLAEDLMAEVLSQDVYKEGLRFGPEVSEALADRSAFDAVDDFDGWSASPPVDSDGTAILGAEGYSRSIEVGYVQLSNTGVQSLTDQGIVKITVTVKFGEKTVATLYACRTDAWQAPQEVN
ncbi:MAG: type II secretion system protein [Planctomycetota bacterium]